MDGAFFYCLKCPTHKRGFQAWKGGLQDSFRFSNPRKKISGIQCRFKHAVEQDDLPRPLVNRVSERVRVFSVKLLCPGESGILSLRGATSHVSIESFFKPDRIGFPGKFTKNVAVTHVQMTGVYKGYLEFPVPYVPYGLGKYPEQSPGASESWEHTELSGKKIYKAGMEGIKLFYGFRES